MIFFLLIVFPFLIPIVYFVNVRLIFNLYESWYWLLIIVLALDLIYFFLLYLRNKGKLKTLSVFFIYSLFIMALGFAFNSILANGFVINLFSIIWPLFIAIFLYSVLHYSYETPKLSLIDIKNIIPYINVASIFLLSSILLNFNIYLAMPRWMALVAFIISSVIFSLPFFHLYLRDFKISFFYSLALTLIMSEVLIASFYLPTGFYVLGAMSAIIYYLMIILLKKKLDGVLMTKDIVRHFIFASILLIIILSTGKWI